MNKSNVVRLALVGIGSWSGVIANAVKRSEKAELATCFTRSPEKRKAYCEKYGCDQEESYDDVVKRDDVDGVLLTTPNAVHSEQAVLAAQHGKHVFV
ncbi:MAG: Gfo/Idh/MocA family oxidoreductase, partial [candidate division Zixibacteria bacterium]|nr:Gfo/Idh/MocA family oxidoreductase [candidate division Zixibacteria bacterium]